MSSSLPAPKSSSATSRIMERYEKLSEFGDGAYSKVYKCRLRDTGQLVAIKRFKDSDEDEMIKKIAMREIRLLKNLKHPNLINLIEVFRRKKHLHLVFEFCDMTVLNMIEKNQKGVPVHTTMSIMWQTLQVLNYCHQQNCIHRDIKPENILLTNAGVVKLCDFGFARIISPGESITEYVATRWYRAPELLVGDTHYNSKVDVWAIGCVFVELINGEALWPGKSDIDQLYLIRRNVGDFLPRHMQIFHANAFFGGMNIPNPGVLDPLEKKLSRDKVGNEGVDFMMKCLEKDPGKRWSCETLLRHPFWKTHSFKPPKVDDQDGRNSSGSYGGSRLPQLNKSGHYGSPDGRGHHHQQGGYSHNSSYGHLPTI